MEFKESKIKESKIKEGVRPFPMEEYEHLLASLKTNAEKSSMEDIERKLLDMEKIVKHPDRNIEIYTDPTLDTFCCVEVRAKKIDEQGNIVDDPSRTQYLIGAPFLYIAGNAPDNVIRGEIYHEVGHALYTDWKLMSEFRNVAMQEGYNPTEILYLNNCVEDPRMERVVGGPINVGRQSALFEKNKLLVIPNIAAGIEKKTPPEQFCLLLKLEGLWNIYENELSGVEKPWSLKALHPEVQRLYAEVETDLLSITGTSEKPALKLSKKYKEIFIKKIWGAYKELIDKFPEQDNDQQGEEGQDGQQNQEGQGGEEKQAKLEQGARSKQEGKEEGQDGQQNQEGQGGEEKQAKLKQGARSRQGGKSDPEQGNFDPNNPSSWPPHLQKFLQYMMQKHQARLEHQAALVKTERAKRDKEFAIYKQTEHELLKRRDGFEDPAAREKYNAFSAEMRPTTQAITRLFNRFFPKTEEPEEEWTKRGQKLDVKRLVRRYGTGQERPLGKKEHPQETKFLLQIIVDVSGSMYSDRGGKRIENAVKGCIALAEAAEKANVDVEILASDDGNIKTDKKYLIKNFDEKFSGTTKEKMLSMMSSFGGRNRDADSIRAAVERLNKAKTKAKAEADRVGTLILFITDSTTQEEETRQAVEETRKTMPLEGFAITEEAEVANCVRFHFGKESLIPKRTEELPEIMRSIIEKNVLKFVKK